MIWVLHLGLRVEAGVRGRVLRAALRAKLGQPRVRLHLQPPALSLVQDEGPVAVPLAAKVAVLLRGTRMPSRLHLRRVALLHHGIH